VLSDRSSAAIAVRGNDPNGCILIQRENRLVAHTFDTSTLRIGDDPIVRSRVPTLASDGTNAALVHDQALWVYDVRRKVEGGFLGSVQTNAQPSISLVTTWRELIKSTNR